MQKFLFTLLSALPLGGTVLLIRDGQACVKRGNPPAALVNAFGELARDYGIDHALIRATGSASKLHLSLHGIPPALHQRCRNIWAAFAR